MIDQAIALFMNRRVLRGDADTRLRDVVRGMQREVQSAFVVCDEERPIGVISERDVVVLLSKVYDGLDSSDLRAGDIMASPVHTLPETAPMGEVVRIMKERGFRRVPIVDDKGALSGIVNFGELQNATNAALERRGRDLEAAVEARTAELRSANARLEELTREDSLTGLLNRRAMAERINDLHALARRHGNPYAVILLDIDHFKLFNDSQGHLAGDDVIRGIAESLRLSIRASDAVFRYGGEEFLILLPETDAEGARLVAERVREVVAERGIPHPASPTARHVTVSMGFTEMTARETALGTAWEAIVERADRALYRSKKGGRDRATRWTEADDAGGPTA
jgi:diguanylate cyclase (GGDEF)-like protein